MIRSKAKFRRGRVATIAWFAAIIFLCIVYWWGMTNCVIRDFWDPPYVNKSELLKARLKEFPHHPLWLILGSSHVDDGLRPGLLLQTMRADNAPLIFNFGMGGVDLYRQFVSLQRLVSGGIVPQRAGIEVFAELMDRKTEMFADDPRLVVRARTGELDELCLYGADPAATRRNWLQSRLNPFYKFGMQTPNQTLSLRLLPFPVERFETHPYDAWGWYGGPGGTPPLDQYRKLLEAARREYQNDFTDQFAVSPQFDRIMRKTLDFCRSTGIKPFLLRMPEDRDFQAFYPANVNTAVDAYLAKIEADYQVRMIDARSWYLERDGFTDGHHLTATGAEQFTWRFVREVSNL